MQRGCARDGERGDDADKLEALARAYDLCAKTEPSVAESLPGESAEVPVPTLDTPASRRLANLISKLNDAELIDLLASGWFGTADFPTWRDSFEYAERAFTTLAPPYVTSYGHRWRSGYSRAMAGVEASRRENPGAADPEHGVMLQLSLGH